MPFCPTAQKERKKEKRVSHGIGDPCHTHNPSQICSKFSTPVAGTRLPASTMTESVALRLCFVQRGCVKSFVICVKGGNMDGWMDFTTIPHCPVSSEVCVVVSEYGM